MNALFWQRMHGGSTHFPIVLLLLSVLFDFVALRSHEDTLRRGLHAAGLASAAIGVCGGIGAVISGLVMTDGRWLGNGYEQFHHLFVWPAFGLCVVCVAWRLCRGGPIPQRGLAVYLAGMSLASALTMGAGYWGGEMLLSSNAKNIPAAASNPTADQSDQVAKGHELFLLNCAHCHAQDATGDEGPNLHGVKKSEARIAALIRNGVKGEMPKFGQKLSDADVQALIAFIHSLKE